jgi:hypothetical protein
VVVVAGSVVVVVAGTVVVVASSVVVVAADVPAELAECDEPHPAAPIAKATVATSR